MVEEEVHSCIDTIPGDEEEHFLLGLLIPDLVV
jgi:hypothetical protein